MRPLFLLLLLLPLAFVAACPQPVVQAGCKADVDCGSSQACNVATGVCVCIDDNACDASEFCNLAGSCQQKLECLNNSDCKSPETPFDICDTRTGECITLQGNVSCVLDSQCPYGSFCEGTACVTGCRDDGDCQLGTPCIAGQCDETPGACSSNAFCQFGQLCGPGNRCVDHAARDQLCSECGPTSLACPNDCLIDSSVVPTPCQNDGQCDRGSCVSAQCFEDSDCGGGTCEDPFPPFFPGTCSNKTCQGFFCGASGCDDVNNPCPRGYSCFVLSVVGNERCDVGSGNTQCGGGQSECRGGGENEEFGFCSCTSDADCPVGANATCQNPGPFGSCVIGSTCGPSSGLLCEDLR